jgi:hypothetical protein
MPQCGAAIVVINGRFAWAQVHLGWLEVTPPASVLLAVNALYTSWLARRRT